VRADDALDREFEARLADSSTLAFRVAYSVLRHHQDAEGVVQTAFAKAHRAFRQLRNRDRFRVWLVRMTWRLALDTRRGDLRRVTRESAVPEPDRPPTSEIVNWLFAQSR
jgi:DNA-directed RNA polymerase specialized sigma24 family protein